MTRYLHIHPTDNVVVALEDLAAGTVVEAAGLSVTLTQPVSRGHKAALRAVAAGENVIKYGSPIGHAKADIAPGDHVHTHNVATNLDGKLDYAYTPDTLTPLASGSFPGTFMGYRRKDGKAGIRNELWIIPTVGCVNKTAERLAALASKKLEGQVDGVFAWTHPYGCSQLGDDHTHTQKILASMVRHPNAGGVLVLGLGCENNHVAGFKEVLGDYDPQRVRFLITQTVGDELEEGLSALEDLAGFASGFHREPIPVSELVVGLKCGGSDGFSGITGNPLVGVFSDRLIAHGGTSILTEVPEMFGAETLLMNRCTDVTVFDKTVSLINDFKDYYIRHNQVVYENPSPGNKAGGITTLEEKSLGCTQKGGQSPVVDVLVYGEQVRRKGLNLAQGPGNDIVAVTTLMAAGAHIILFTTGRGTPLGAPVPTMKISTNNELAAQKPHWIDFNAGRLLTGETMTAVADDFCQLVVEVASGAQARNEAHGYREIAIFKDGVTL